MIMSKIGKLLAGRGWEERQMLLLVALANADLTEDAKKAILDSLERERDKYDEFSMYRGKMNGNS